MKQTEKTIKDKNKEYREVNITDACYAIVLRPNARETRVVGYASEEDMLWAYKNGWFDPREVILMKVLDFDISLKKEVK